MSLIKVLADLSTRRNFCITAISQFQAQNRLEGITLPQVAWVSYRLSSPVSLGEDEINLGGNLVTFPPGVEFRPIEVALIGDVELLYCITLKITPDDMSESYHWLSASRVNGLRVLLGTHLGYF